LIVNGVNSIGAIMLSLSESHDILYGEVLPPMIEDNSFKDRVNNTHGITEVDLK